MKDNKPRSCELGLQTSTAGNVCSFCKLCGDQLIPLIIYVIGIFCALCLFTRKTIHGMTGMKHCMYAAMNERAFLRLLFTSPCSYIAQVEFPQGVLKIFSLRSAKS